MIKDIVIAALIIGGVIITAATAAGEAENSREAFWWILGIICAFIGVLVFLVNLQS